MNKYLKIGIIATALVVGVLLIRKEVKVDTDTTDKDFENLSKRIEEAKK
jgi:hypothetical protein